MKKALVAFTLIICFAGICAAVYFAVFPNKLTRLQRTATVAATNPVQKRVARDRKNDDAPDVKSDRSDAAPDCGCPDDMACVKPGEFVMGCTPGDGDCFVTEKPAKLVKISRAFCLDMREVTQSGYENATAKNPSVYKKCGGECPVENVTWNDALEFCDMAGKRLPTEAEWEFAARGGEPGRFYGGGDQRIFWSVAPGLDNIGWYGGNADVRYDGAGECPSPGKNNKAPKRKCGPHAAGTLKPNAYGLFDMLGNVWEWVEDCYDSRWYSIMPGADPVNLKEGCDTHVIRGGSWQDMPLYLRVSYRFRRDYEKGGDSIGFRCAKDAR